ncbi:hypothetical protein FBU30_007157, partial [Linnemannia zychae]
MALTTIDCAKSLPGVSGQLPPVSSPPRPQPINNETNGANSNVTNNTATSSSKDILPFCVGIATNPTRVRIFKDKQSCDISEWKTLFVFTAHTILDTYQNSHPVCVAYATQPERSMIYSERTSCTLNEWKTDFVFYMSGLFENRPTLTHESTLQFNLSKPDRMVFYPTFEGEKNGWIRSYWIGYRSRWRPATVSETSLLQNDLVNHTQVHKRLIVSTPPDSATQRCAQNLIQIWDKISVDANQPWMIFGKENEKYVSLSYSQACNHLVASSIVRAGWIAENGVSSVEVMIDNKIYAAITIRGSIFVNTKYARMALQESLRTNSPIAVAYDKETPDRITMHVAGTFATSGGPIVYQSTIPTP